jgi:Fanconi anemia group M protein
MVDIVADVRERPSDTFAILHARADVDLTVATLDYGDYSIAARLSIEQEDRRRPRAVDRRREAVPAVSALRRHADRPVLLVEGLQPQTAPSGVPWHAIRGALVSVAVIFGVPVLSAEGPDVRRAMNAASISCRRPIAAATGMGHSFWPSGTLALARMKTTGPSSQFPGVRAESLTLRKLPAHLQERLRL